MGSDVEVGPARLQPPDSAAHTLNELMPLFTPLILGAQSSPFDTIMLSCLHRCAENPGSALSPPSPTLRACVVEPCVFSPSSSPCDPCNYMNRNPCCPARFLCSFHSYFLEELSILPLSHSKKDYYATFQAYRKCHTYPLSACLALSSESSCQLLHTI